MTARHHPDSDRAAHLVQRGARIVTAAKLCGVSVQTVRRALARLGVPPRRVGRPPSAPPR